MYYISYSLFGSDRRYMDGLLQCIAANRLLYPEWECIVYYDESINPKWIKELEREPVKIEPRGARTKWDGLYWRFEVYDRSDCECAIIRDTDSIPDVRERDLTLEWLRSEKKIHIIRDHPNHNWPINAGMWGARGTFPFKFQTVINKWKWKQAKCGDQHLLRRVIYRKYYKESFIHTCYIAFKGEAVNWTQPTERYVGRRYFDPIEPIPRAERSLLKRRSRNYEFRLEFDFYRRKMKRAFLEKFNKQ